jgi:nitrogen fixation NifU-like protein
MNIYQARLTDYYQHPRNKGTLEQCDFASDLANPLCGDAVTMQGIVRDGLITKIVFDGRGCVISQAIASMLTELCVDKTPEEILALTPDFAKELVGIPLGPTRLKCALLPLQALQEAIAAYKRDKTDA